MPNAVEGVFQFWKDFGFIQVEDIGDSVSLCLSHRKVFATLDSSFGFSCPVLGVS